MIQVDSIKQVVKETQGRVKELKQDSQKEKIKIFENGFSQISTLLSDGIKLGSNDASYKEYLPLYQSFVKTSSLLNDMEEKKGASGLVLVYEEYFKELGKQLDILTGAVVSGVTGGSVGHIIPKSIDEFLAGSSSTGTEVEEKPYDDIGHGRYGPCYPGLETGVESSGLHDFGDGNGQVSAHRHINPDKSKGGFVADTAKVEEGIYIGPDASVYGYAQVLKGSKINDKSKVYGNAVVSETSLNDNSEVCDKAIVSQSKIKGNSRIYDEAQVSSSTINGDTSIGVKRNVINLMVFDNKSMNKDQLGQLLRNAAANGDIEGMKKYLQLGVEINYKEANTGNTLLHLIMEKNRDKESIIKAIELLVNHGANVNAQNREGWTPLHVAARYGHVEAIELLVSLGANVNAQDINGYTPLHGAAIRFSMLGTFSRTSKVLRKLGGI